MAGPEEMDEMLQRHRKEAKDLQAKEMEMKKGAAKGSKAEQKAKKKQVEEAVAKLTEELKQRHADEIAALTASSGGAASASAEGAAAALAALRLYAAGASEEEGEGAGGGRGRPSKAQKRREKKQEAEKERERRIEEEQSTVVSDRSIEDKQLAAKLHTQGLSVREVKPDGHCLFRALEDQLQASHNTSSSSSDSCNGKAASYLELRRLAAGYMRTHPDVFMPFVEVEAEDGGGGDEASRFEQYCRELEETAAWGGQLELQALSKVLRRRIVVHCAGLPDVEISPEDTVAGAGAGAAPDAGEEPLRLSFHRHAYGLGEHYNSVVKLVAEAEGKEEEMGGEEEDEEEE